MQGRSTVYRIVSVSDADISIMISTECSAMEINENCLRAVASDLCGGLQFGTYMKFHPDVTSHQAIARGAGVARHTAAKWYEMIQEMLGQAT